MVRHGEYLERMVVVRSGELHLEGLYHRGRVPPPLVICAPHPQQGGSMDGPVVAELAWACTRAGHATLRFNYRGVGASEGAWSGGEGEVGDAIAAAEQMAENAGTREVALAGYSFGAWVALEAALRRGDVPALVLVAPPAPLFDFSRLRGYGGRALVIAGGADPGCDLAALPEVGRRVVVPEADHFFARGLGQVGRHAALFLG